MMVTRKNDSLQQEPPSPLGCASDIHWRQLDRRLRAIEQPGVYTALFTSWFLLQFLLKSPVRRIPNTRDHETIHPSNIVLILCHLLRCKYYLNIIDFALQMWCVQKLYKAEISRQLFQKVDEH